MKITDFLYTDSDWQQLYKGPSDSRYDTFKIALNILMQMPRDIHILETGCQRIKDDWGGGCSSKIFMHFLREHWYAYQNTHNQLVSIDISLPNIKVAYAELEHYIDRPWVTCTPILANSLDAMQRLTEGKTKDEDLQAHPLAHKLGDEVESTRFDFIYLDSLDADLEDEENNRLAQEHQLKEAKLAQDLFKETNSLDGFPKILLLDDNRLPFGGKTKLTKEYLLNIGWILLYDWQQSLWVKF